MKRINSENRTRDPSQIRGIDNGTSISRENEDVSCRKRVKFTDLDNVSPISCRPAASFIPFERTRATKSDDPKTSEFAFFKKLKEDAGHRFHSHSLCVGENQSNKFESSACSSERFSVVKNSFKDFRSSLINEDSAPRKFGSIVTPLGSASKNKGTRDKLAGVFSRKREKLRQWVVNESFPEIEKLCSNGYDFISVLLSRLFPESKDNNGFKDLKLGNVEINAKSPLSSSLESDIRLRKLHQMSRWSFVEPEAEQYLDDGSSCWLNKSGEKIFSNYDSPTSFTDKSHTTYKIREPEFELQGRMPVLCSETESAFGISFEKYGSLALSYLKEMDRFHDSNEYCVAREPSTLRLCWEFDNMTDERSSSVNNHNTELSMYPTSLSLWGDDHEQSLNNKYCASELCTSSFLSSYQQNSSSGLHSPLTSYGNHEFGRHVLVDQEDTVAELDHVPLTVWRTPNYRNLAEDFNYGTDHSGGSIILSPQNHHCFMSMVFTDRQQHPGMENFLLSSGLEEQEDTVAELNHDPLTMWRAPNYLSLAEDFNYITDYKGGSMILSPQNHHCIMSKVLSERYEHPGMENFLSFGTDFDLGWKCLSLTDSSREHQLFTNHALQLPQIEGVSSHFLTNNESGNCPDDSMHRETLNHFHDWSSFYFQASLGREKACPLLLYKSRWKGSEGESYFGDNEVEYD